MSTSSRAKSTRWSLAATRRSISGWLSANRPSRPTSHFAAKSGETLTVSTPERCRCVRRSVPSAIWSSASRTTPRYSRPASVMTSRWRSRLKSLSPSSVSSAFTCWLTAPGVTNSSSAARVKLLLRAAASKALTALSEGRRRGIRPFYQQSSGPGEPQFTIARPISITSIDFLNLALKMIDCGWRSREDDHIALRESVSGSSCSRPILEDISSQALLRSPWWDEERPVSDRSVSISPPSLTPGKSVPSPSAAARTKLLLEGPILPTLLRLAAPNVLTLLAFAGVITFDGFFLGRIGTNARAGVSSAVARALGAGRRDRADALVFHAFLLALAIAAIFSTVLLIGAPFMFRWMGGRNEMLTDALAYADVALGGAVCICVSNLLGNTVRA